MTNTTMTSTADHGAISVALPVEPLTVTIQQAILLSGLGNTTIYALIGEGKLKSTTVGKRRLIDYASLKALLTPTVA